MFIFAYGLLCYILFLGTFLYVIGFVEGLVVPKTINDGVATPTMPAALIDAALLGVFAVQHTVMARPAFKRWWTQYIPKAAERSTFVLATCLAFGLLFWQWRPIPGTAWSVGVPAARVGLMVLSFAGWGLVLYASFLIDHFDLFGLRQVWLHLRGRSYSHPSFARPMLYRLVRNPLMLGFLMAFWAWPEMSYGRLLFCAVTTGYILMGIRFEERDLLKILGEPYRRYRSATPMLLPWPRPRSDSDTVDVAV